MVDPPPLKPIRLDELWIKHKDERMGLVPLRLNEIQSAYADEVVPNWREGDYDVRGVRHNILKFRQPGFSTLIDALLYCWTTSKRHFKAWIVAGDDDGAKLLFEMVQRFYENDPRQLRTRYNREDKLTFPDLDSEISVHTAGKLRLGRGTTINALHMSELAWWDSLRVRGGLLQAVPKESGNVFEETTAHGFNEYHAKYEDDRAGKTNFRAFFFSWLDFKEYSSPAAEGFHLDEEERKLIEMYGAKVTMDKLQWRREKKLELDKTDTPFVQEYPANDVEAFVSSGNPYFNRAELMKIQELLKDEKWNPLDDLVFSPLHYPHLRSLYADDDLKLYCLPRNDHDYVIAADPSKGIDDGGVHDYAAAHVFDVQTWEQCAVVHGYFTPSRFGQILHELAWYFNEALIGVHQLGGDAVLSELQHHVIQPSGKLGYPLQLGEECTGIYTFDHSHIRGVAAPQRTITRQAGWPETERSKIYMLDVLQRALEDDSGMIIYDRATVRELLSFVKLPGGGAGAESGCHDDLVSALALIAVLLTLRFRRASTRSKIRWDDQEPRTSGKRIGGVR